MPNCPADLKASASVSTAVQEITASLGDHASHPLIAQQLATLCALSPYIARTCRQYPEALLELLELDVFDDTAVPPTLATLETDLQSAFDALHDKASLVDVTRTAFEALQMQTLRRFRHKQMLRILIRDITGIASLDETLLQLSLCADACIRCAADWADAHCVSRFGEPYSQDGVRQRLIVLGMGKLGGYELNVSSDIDLICLFPSSGSSDGQKSIDNGDFFRRVVQQLTRLLNSPTADGFVYRVDTRLRPFGESGPLVINFDGLENYYLTQGRDWERYAMIKARAITGDTASLSELDELITPFVYRRYLDYNAIESLRELKRKIALSLRQKQMVDNLKLGAGGIREIEFIAQAFQLVRGGRDTRLRQRSLRAVLDELAQQGLMPQDEVDNLHEAYDFLRRAENAVQMMRDEQLHSLPVDEEDKQRLLCLMGFMDWQVFRDDLATHQNRVDHMFNALFRDDGQTDAPDPVDNAARDSWAVLSSIELEEQDYADALTAYGFKPTDELMASVASVCRGAYYQRLTARGQERVDEIVPRLMQATRGQSAADEVLSRCLKFVRSVAGRSGYLQALIDKPSALALLVKLFGESLWLANFVTRQPVVLDELLIHGSVEAWPDATSVRKETLSMVARLHDEELDVQMDTLRQFRQAREFRIAIAELTGELPLMKVSDQLTWLAESLIEAVLLLVEKPLREKHGEPQCLVDGKPAPTDVGVIAYGKLGGIELGFGSDLDLVFVHSSYGDRQQTSGEKPVDNSVYYVRLAQKFVHFMTTATPAGILYEIDLRLRPNGSSGMLVTGIETFEGYQRGDAWTWEHQALMRARIVVSGPSLSKQFDQLRRVVLGQPRSPDELREAVSAMRKRMRDALGSAESDRMHLKQDDGGVADIEFVVQYLVLANAAEHPTLLTYTDNVRVLESVNALGLVTEDVAKQLTNCYLELRARLHRRALQECDAVVPYDRQLKEIVTTVVAIREEILGKNH